jgi:hypothetical protein
LYYIVKTAAVNITFLHILSLLYFIYDFVSLVYFSLFSLTHIVAGRKNALRSTSSYTTPPLTPDKLPPRCNSFSYNGVHTSFTSNRSSYGSIGVDEAFPPPPSPTCMSKFEHTSSTQGESQGHRLVL